MSKEMRFLAGSNATSTNPLNDVISAALVQCGQWSVAAMREPGFRKIENVESDGGFRALAPLTEKAQVVIDRAVVEVGLQRLTLVADLLNLGLTYNLSDPLSVAYLEHYTLNKVGAAQRTMSPEARGENKLPIMAPNRLPIYLTTDNFAIDIRTLKTSQRVGTPLDTMLVKQCTRSVNEAIEDAAINGATTLDGQALSVGGYTAPGIVNAPNAETGNLTAAAWDATPVGATIFAEVQAMISALQANKKFGPYYLYIPTAVSSVIDNDYSTSTNTVTTIRQRLLQIDGLAAIRTADLMPATKVVLVQMTSDVIDVVVGQPPTVIPWTSLSGMTIHNLVMAIMVPRVRADAAGDSGIYVGTIA